jgi:hypothetical protein
MKTAGFIDASLKILIKGGIQALFIVIFHKVECDFHGAIADICQSTLTDLLETMSSQIVHLMRFLIPPELDIWSRVGFGLVVVHQKLVCNSELKRRGCVLSIWIYEGN